MTKLLLLDCDGTIRRSKSGATFINEPHDQEAIPEAESAIAHYYRQGWTIIGITNQGGVAAGHKSLEDATTEQKYTLQICPWLDAIIFCPDYEGKERCDVFKTTSFLPSIKDMAELHNSLKGTYRKPGAGMLLWTMEWLGIDKADCLYVGDRPEDEQAAANAGVKFLWNTEWYEPD